MLGARFRKLSVCIALTANSIRSSIGSLFFHGMPRFYLTTPPKSVTYVLNLLCYLCSEPAPILPLRQRQRQLPEITSSYRALLLPNGRPALIAMRVARAGKHLPDAFQRHLRSRPRRHTKCQLGHKLRRVPSHLLPHL